MAAALGRLTGMASRDAVVIGAGVLGLSTALELARNGRRTLLVERGETPGGETSAAWFRILHGGLRYLQRLDLVRHRQSIAARAEWLRRYPEETAPLPCLMPLYGRGLKRPAAFRAAFALDALLAFDRNRGIQADRHLPAGRVLDRAQTRDRYPAVPTAGLEGAALWHDAIVPDDRALMARLAAEATAAGVEIRTHTEVVRLETGDGRVQGIVAADGWRVGTDAAIVTAGPWTRGLAAAFDRDVPALFRPSLAFNLLLDRLPPVAGGLAVQAARADAPVLFVYPLDGGTFCGTWHRPWPGKVQRPVPDAAEIRAFLADLDSAIPSLGAGEKHIRRVFAGLLPAARDGTAELADRPVLIDHGASGGPRGLLSATDVKFTTAPALARRIRQRLDRIVT